MNQEVVIHSFTLNAWSFAGLVASVLTMSTATLTFLLKYLPNYKMDIRLNELEKSDGIKSNEICTFEKVLEQLQEDNRIIHERINNINNNMVSMERNIVNLIKDTIKNAWFCLQKDP